MSQNTKPIVRKPSRKTSVIIAVVLAVLLTVFASILTANIAHVSDAVNEATASVIGVLLGGMNDAGRGIINALTIPLLVLLCCGISCALAWYVLRAANVEKHYAFLLSLIPVAAPVLLSFLSGGFGLATWLALLGGVLCVAGMVFYDYLTKRFPRFFQSEAISYIFFGALTTAISFITQMIFTAFGWWTVFSTIGSWVCAVTFAYIVNRLFVFKSKASTKEALLREVGMFFGMRLISGVFEVVFMVVAVDWCGFADAPCKLIAQVVILVSNYVFSKLVIFRNKDDNTSGDKKKALPDKHE